MKAMTSHDFYQYLLDKLVILLPEHDISDILKNGYIDKKSRYAISVFSAPSSRGGSQICVGGIDSTSVREFQVNMLIRWGNDTRESDIVCSDIYKALLSEQSNITSGNIEIAYIQLLDSHPISLGRDDMNVCESSIRANIYYYI